MKQSSGKVLRSALAVTAGLALASTASAYNAFPYVESMGHDADSFNPQPISPGDPSFQNDPGYSSSLPPGYVSPTPSDFTSDWDVAVLGTGNGDLEEVTSGYNGVATGDHSGHFGILQMGDVGSFYAYRDGPFTRANRSSNIPQTTPISNVQDIYIDPAEPIGATFWINNGVNNTGGTYLSEDSFRVGVTATGWNVTAAGSTSEQINDLVIAPGQWTRWIGEVFDPGNGLLAFRQSIYAADVNGDYNILLGSAEVGSYNGVDFTDLGGPRWTWLFNGNGQDLGYLFVDNIGWTDGTVDIGADDPPVVVPEPASLGLLGLGSLLALRRRSR